MQPSLSIVVPVFNEQENVRPLYEAVREALDNAGSWELLLVDDGSEDATRSRAQALSHSDARVRVIGLARNFGQTAAMQAGFEHAAAEVIVTMDGDLQNDPRDIPMLVERLREGYDLVAGYRVDRQDPLTRRLPSWAANRLIHWVTGVDIRDNGCSLKAFRRELLRRFRLYSDMHRFIPAVAVGVAGARITEVPVRHHARRHGQSKYGPSRILKVLADIVTITMIRSFRDQPLRLFGVGAIAATGASLLFVATFLFMLVRPTTSPSVVLPGAGIVSLGLALYLVMLGLIGEAMVRRKRSGPASSLPIVREWPGAGP